MTILLLQGLLGLGFIGLGIYRFVNLDAAREKQSRLKQAPQSRIEAWERRYVTVSTIAVFIGLFFIGASLVSVLAPQPPAGEYICLPTNTSSNEENTFLVLQRDGTGSYDGLSLTWTAVSDKPIQVVFGGQAPLVAGAFAVKDDPKSFVVSLASGGSQLCLLR